MSFRRSALIALCALAFAGAASAESPDLRGSDLRAAAGPTSDWRESVLNEINFARTRPAEYAEVLREYRDVDGDRDPEVSRPRFDGSRAMNEAIDFLDHQAPLPPLDEHPGLDRSAGLFASEQNAHNRMGHVSADGETLGQRLHAQQVWFMQAGEAISYGEGDPAAVVRQLIIDDGVADRGHRAILFSPAMRYAGVGCGPHPRFGVMCVIDLSGAMVAR